MEIKNEKIIYLSIIAHNPVHGSSGTGFIPTYANSVEGSPISRVYPSPMGSCGDAGPYFTVSNLTSQQEFHQHHIAAFLNWGASKYICKEVIETLENAFNDVLTKDESGLYVYTGEIMNLKNSSFAEYFNEDIETFLKAREQTDYIEALNSSKRGKYSPINFMPSQSQSIDQGFIGITDIKSEKPILGTVGAGPCLILVIYNPTVHSVLLTHIDPHNSLDSLSSYIEQVSQGASEKLHVHMAGGDTDNKQTREKILGLITMIKSNSNLEIISTDFGHGFYKALSDTISYGIPIPTENAPKSLAIDARTGEIFHNFRSNALSNDLHSINTLKALPIN